MIPALLDILRPSLCLPLLVGLTTCHNKACDFPEMPPNRHYRLDNAEEFPVSVTSIMVDDDLMTIDYLDEAGEAQQVVFQIIDEGRW